MPIQKDIVRDLCNSVTATGTSPQSNPTLRILLIVESTSAGTGRHVLDLAEGLLARGFTVHLLYATGRIDRIFSDRLNAMPSLRKEVIEMRRAIHPRDMLALSAVCRYAKAAGPFDIIHGHASKGGAMARLASLFTGVPAFYTPHSSIMLDPTLPRWKRLLYMSIERGLARATACLIAVAPEEARAAAALKLRAARVAVVANGIGQLDLLPRREARLAMDVPDDALVVGFIGRLVAQKAPDVLLHAFARTAASIPNAYLAMIGSGPIEQHLRELARSLGVAGKVRWLGQRDARAFLSGFDLFAIASRKEGLPYVILEAMAAGLPVVATSSSGVESLLKHGENGFITPPDAPGAFADGIIALLSDPQRRAAFGRESLSRVAHFSIDAMVDGTLRLYRTVATTALSQLHRDREGVPEGAAL